MQIDWKLANSDWTWLDSSVPQVSQYSPETSNSLGMFSKI